MRLLRDPQVVLTALCGIALILGLFGIHPIIPYLSVAFGAYFALWSYRRADPSREESVRLPGGLPRGILKVRTLDR